MQKIWSIVTLYQKNSLYDYIIYRIQTSKKPLSGFSHTHNTSFYRAAKFIKRNLN